MEADFTWEDIIGAGITDSHKPRHQEQEPEAEEPKVKVIKYPQHIIDKAIKIMKEEDPSKFIMTTFNTLHVGDRNTGKILMVSISGQSVKNSQGLQPKLFGKSGKGKTHSAKSMLHLIPEEYKLVCSLSDKALYYAHVKPGTIVFSDDINLSDELESIIKRATSNFQSNTVHVTVNKERALEQHTIPPRIVWLLTSVDDNYSNETLNRFVETGVDESNNQDEAVFQQQIERDMTGRAEFPINEDVLICRAIFSEIKSKLFTVIIPFANKIRWEDKVNRRNFPVFMDIVKSFAVLRFLQRKQIVDGSDTILEATMDDFNDAKDLYTSRAENQKLKLTDTEIKLVRQMEVNKEYEASDIQEMLNVSQPRVYQIMHGQKGKKHGLLSKIPELYSHKQTIEDEYDNKKRITKTIYVLKRNYGLDTYGSVVSIIE